MFIIRQASAKDIGLIRKLASNTWFSAYKDILSDDQAEYMFEMMYSEDSLKKQMSEEGHMFYIASFDGAPSGYVSVQKRGKSIFHIHKLYVLPEKQDKGIGKLLIEKVFDFARTESGGGACSIELNVNRHNKAVSFYKRMGMYISRQGDFDIGNGYFMNDYIMRIDL